MASRRGSKQREAILRILQNTDIHPTADWIYEQVRKVIPNISLGTVYRNLNLLKDEGLIREVTIHGSSSARYDANLEPHYHFICLKCNSVYDLPIRENSLNLETFLAGRNFKVKFTKLDIFGLCDKCLIDESN
ncbi:Fur family transcriptional regulator, ferric uptake regulator [Candidatus Kryptonium thompsonii]|jgi:Fe2+ or Zn2+ uptake regulation protein|uniref:Fur family transcriptional regulator, ferric uptake regulator n=1 Tax=Candidatus Kryptonium thompsonii TaxID=1633631 RepID=A0A0P1M295_9BACT|nr:transcriptional repressor [Candidatus Kryptonium thompsoni]CUS84156.1 Fur family transcriptional regulator, ferric uptake regulator [Candidatus Kryptonium thompsoni]CUS85485.1 Fur family transcriptional regulator, ferric uptake regulator [Candidatus Kryptonium thompsoni]CUS86095.1 Fur family transcriptional regulator, ferric uptake regulator [Candidatus Kryptonium thompsoni]CUS88583.1 Fur family transcriptional regulator, ferric uptake regulator [Candidatus Kryptonium thompsoni]CUS90165.1 F